MQRILSSIQQVAVLAALVLAFAIGVAAPSNAATQNYITDVPVQVIPLHLAGQYTANVTGAARFQLPYKARLIGVSASARASGGTSPTLTVDVKDDGASALSAPVAVTAGSVAEATIANAAVVDESVITVDLAIGGTSPTWNDITVLITVVRE